MGKLLSGSLHLREAACGGVRAEAGGDVHAGARYQCSPIASKRQASPALIPPGPMHRGGRLSREGPERHLGRASALTGWDLF